MVVVLAWLANAYRWLLTAVILDSGRGRALEKETLVSENVERPGVKGENCL